MGLRTASVRHTNALVMAPALTDANQSQNFTIPPSSPINANNINDYAYTRDDNNKKYLNKSNGLNLIKYDNNHQLIKIGQKSINFIMSEGPNTLGDTIDDTMGLQKANMDAVASLLKDKNITNDVEQLLNNLDTMPGTADINTGAPDIVGQNVDELMQVSKFLLISLIIITVTL